MTTGVTHDPVEKTKESYAVKIIYQDTDAKVVGNLSDKFNTIAGFNAGATAIFADAALTTAHGGTPVRDTDNETFSATLKSHDPNGELYMVNFGRGRVTLTSYADETIRTITDRKRAEEAFKETNKKLNLLSSITRHDINNQLTVLLGYLDIIEEQQPNPTLHEYCQKASGAAKRITTMIQFTKTYESIGVNEPTWQDTHALIETAVKDIALGKIQVVNDLPPGTEIYADPLIVKVFFNLMDNATKYGGEGMTTIRFSSGNLIVAW